MNRNEGMGNALGNVSGVFLYKTGFYLLTTEHVLRSAGYFAAKHAAGKEKLNPLLLLVF